MFFQETFERGRYEYCYLVKVIAPGQFRAVPAQISPMYVPGAHASSEPQAFTIAAPAAGTDEAWPLITAWILAGGALTAGVYWAFLNTPESTILALITSAVLPSSRWRCWA